MIPAVESLDARLTIADDQFNKGQAGMRAMRANYNTTTERLEQTTFILSKWPNSLAQKPTEEVLQAHTLEWRRNLAQRQYLELRKELGVVATPVIWKLSGTDDELQLMTMRSVAVLA